MNLYNNSRAQKYCLVAGIGTIALGYYYITMENKCHSDDCPLNTAE